MKSPRLILLLAALVVIGAVLVNVASNSDDRASSVRPDAPQGDGARAVLTESSCTTAGGIWNACGSACRTTPDAPCIEVCVEYCQCASDTQCPTGLTCGDFVDGVGVCL
ncbi:hypothetical protein HY631_01495 [Candidatus Uhrbacteria bacterium]|nr:hypothetical protein [Candidatus Uhrbacteria bacterium]